ncbi:MAG: putative Ribonuclease [Bacteroidota bacterium]|nr:putative Ribonuclease [Bacteroidota bacterium]
MELSVVIPIYHTATNAVRSIPEVIPALQSKFNDFEIIFVIDNDGVPDEVKALFTLQDIYKQVKIYRLNKNHGQHFATLTGYYFAKGDHILSIDEDMTQYVTKICRNNDYMQHDIYYWHYNKNNMYNSVIRKILSILFKAAIHKLINFKKNSTFRVMTKELRDKMMLDKHIFWNIDVMIFNNTAHVGGCVLELSDINDHDSGYNYKTLANVAFEIAYEHNLIFMNLLFAVFPALAVHLVFQNMTVTAITYFVIVILITLFFTGVKKLTPSTGNKILAAIYVEKDRKSFKPVSE